MANVSDNEKRGNLTGGAASAEVVASSKKVLARGRGGSAVGLQQFYSPAAIATFIHRALGSPDVGFDPTAGDGALLAPFKHRFGIEIDPDQVRAAVIAKRDYVAVKGDLQQAFPLLRRVAVEFPHIVANPPFGLEWNVSGRSAGSSTAVAFDLVVDMLEDGGAAAFIAGRDRFEREIAAEPARAARLYAVVEVTRLFKGVELPCVVAFLGKRARGRIADAKTFHAKVADPTVIGERLVRDVAAAQLAVFDETWPYVNRGEIEDRFEAVQKEIDRRNGRRLLGQKHTIELAGGALSVRPSAFAAIALAKHVDGNLYKWLTGFDKQPPSYFALQPREWHRVTTLAEEDVITIAPEALAQVQTSLDELQRFVVPLYTVPHAQRLGFLVDVDSIRCVRSSQKHGFEAGQRYPLTCGTRVVSSLAEREKQTVEGPEVIKVIVEKKAMEIAIDGKKFCESAEDLEFILAHFDVPDPGELATRFPAEIQRWEHVLEEVEREIQAREPGFVFRSFQPRDLARLLFKQGGILAWEQGLGKTLGMGSFVRALELVGEVDDGCALFIMPQDLALQSETELMRFFGRQLYFVTHLGYDVDHPRPKKRKPNEVTALELREMVLARRADLKAQRKGVHLCPRKPVWAATWFEALAVSQRVEEAAPLERVMREERILQHARVRGQHWDNERQRYVEHEARDEIRRREPVHSNTRCPRCLSDAGKDGKDGKSAWNPSTGRCDVELKVLENVAYGEDQRGLDWDAMGKTGFSTFYRPEGASARRSTCGYRHVALKRKPAYSVLGNLFRCVIVDEGTKIKGDTSLASQAVRAFRAPFKLLATGTPIKNFVTDLFWLMWWALGDKSPRFPYAYEGGKQKFTEDFAVIETRCMEKSERKDPKGRPKVLPEVSNLLRLWKMLCSSLVRRRMDEVGAVVQLDGSWKCPGCKESGQVVMGAEWVKPPHLRCASCNSVWDSIVPITYVPVQVPWGKAQKKFYADWLNVDNFVKHFKRRHPESPLIDAGDAVIGLLAAAIGQLAKLNYATTDPTGDPDDDYKTPDLSPWTPARLKILQLAAEHAAKGEQVLIGSTHVAPGPWIAAELARRGVSAGHICDLGSEGKMVTKAPKQRGHAMAAFRSGKTRVLCVGVQAVALGHNLDCANIGIIDGLPWDFASFDQWIKRIRRLTSKKPITVYVMLPENSLATKIWMQLVQKTAASDLALDGKIASQTEKPIDRAVVLRELQEAGARLDGTEVPEADVRALWAAWKVGAAADIAPPAAAPAPPAGPAPPAAKPRQLVLFAA